MASRVRLESESSARGRESNRANRDTEPHWVVAESCASDGTLDKNWVCHLHHMYCVQCIIYCKFMYSCITANYTIFCFEVKNKNYCLHSELHLSFLL